MLNVSEATKQAFMSDVSHKSMRVVFPELGLSYDNSSIEVETLKLTEAISNKDSVEFVGCIASRLDVNIYGINADIKNRIIQVFISADDTDEIPIFNGIVDSAVISSDSMFKDIVAYDVLYSKGNSDVVNWYNSQFPNKESKKTLKELRDSLCAYLGINQVETVLPNDEIVIGKKYEPKSLKCISVLKSICQLNGCCGIINRQGLFEYRYIRMPSSIVLNPSTMTFPSATTYPVFSNISYIFNFYEKMKFEEYFVKPMKRVQIRSNEKDSGVTVGSDSGNKYIIQANILANGLLPSVAEAAALNILNKLSNVKYHPFDAKNNGMPFIEVGDSIKYIVPNRSGAYGTDAFTILSRTLSGVQILKDNYNSKGNEEQSEFITDLNITLDMLKLDEGVGGDLSDYYTKEEIADYISDYTYDKAGVLDVVSDAVNNLNMPTNFGVQSVYNLPTKREPNILYLVQSDLVVVR